MAQDSTSSIKSHNPAQDNFRTRLIARLVVTFISLTQVGQRLYFSFAETELAKPSIEVYLITLPFLGTLAFIVMAEFLLHRKLGSTMLKYAAIVDILFCLVFTGEWLTTLYAALIKVKSSTAQCYSVSAIFGFTSFSWRTLLQAFVTQNWYFKIVPPMCAYGLVIGYAITTDPSATQFILIRGLLQVSYVLLIFFLENKINFKLLIGNMYQERWVQINEFILNNIPENIAILDLNGNIKYLSEYFKEFMRLHSNSMDPGKFFKRIRNLQRQHSELDSFAIHIKGLSPFKRDFSSESIYYDTTEEAKNGTCALDSLEILISTFRSLVLKGNIEEKSFFIFNGKMAQEDKQQERSIEIKISFITQHSKSYIILMLRDTTERDHLLTLEGSIKYKDYLLASVSHELRTPLNGNINLVEAAIKSTEVSESVKEGLLVPALKSSKFLLHLINDILDMSQIKAQKLRLVFQQANIRETFSNTLQLLELHAKKKAITLELNLDPLLPATFCTDHVRLSQIVLNLINNSIKFTKEGYVRLSAAFDEDLNMVKVSVEDTGIGMNTEDINKLFQDFTHIENKERELLNPTGVGLGLNIAHNLAKLLGPKGNKGISVMSVPHEGSTFCFVIEDKQVGMKALETERIQSLLLPVADEMETAKEPSVTYKMLNHMSTRSFRAPSEVRLFSPKSRCSCADILVVDDDPFNILAYEAISKSLNTKVDSVYSGKSAIDKMLNRIRYPCGPSCHLYSIVFMDQEMPGMTGIETVREIQNLQAQNLLPQVNIIGCSAHQDRDHLDEFMKVGIAEYIQKPVSCSMIKEVLRRYGIV